MRCVRPHSTTLHVYELTVDINTDGEIDFTGKRVRIYRTHHSEVIINLFPNGSELFSLNWLGGSRLFREVLNGVITFQVL